MEYVSQAEFDAIVIAMGNRQEAVARATEKLLKARTLAAKIEAKRELAAARAMPVGA